MKILISKSPEQTKKIAAQIVQKLQPGDILALSGDLGGGKTTFVQGIARALKIKQNITSPTFVLLKSYRIFKQKFKNLIHIDLYRLKNLKETEALGLSDFLGKANNICVVEWAEKIKRLLPPKTIWLEFDFIDQNTRQIKIKGLVL